MIGNVEVDVLGRWESGPGLETPNHVMKSLLRNGVLQEWFIPDAVLFAEDDELVLYDPNGERQVASFLLSEIHDPVAFVSKTGTGKAFSKVVIFAVHGSGHFQSNHLFIAVQCLNSDPTELVEKLEAAAGQLKRRVSATSIPGSFTPTIPSFTSAHRRAPSSTLSNGSDTPVLPTGRRQPGIGGGGGVLNSFGSPFRPPKPGDPVTRTESFSLLEKPSFQYDHSDDPVQKDSILINYCIEDIERLCSELKDAREGNPGSRALDTFKATEFTSIFQKIKLSFIILGRLNPHIRDPDASDIVHHIMPPLAFLMDACGDLFNEELQRDVVSPLLTSQAVVLLQGCLTYRENAVWEACGPAWRLPRREYAGDAVPYKPLFYDGWSPGYLDFADEDGGDYKPGNVVRDSGRQQPRSSNGQQQPRNGSADGRYNGNNRRNSETESDYGSEGSIFKSPDISAAKSAIEKEAFRDKLMERGALIALVTHAWNGHNSKELSVKKGDYLEVLNNDKKWWRCRDSNNKIGHVPYTLLTTIIYKEASLPDIPEPTYKEPVKPILKDSNAQTIYAEPERNTRRSSKRHSRRESSPSSSPEIAQPRRASPTPSLPPPPPPQPQKFQQPEPVFKQPHRKSYRSNSIETSYSMQDELRNVLNAISEEKAKHLDIRKTQEVYIDQRSTAKEVQKWLTVKQFSPRVHSQFEGFNGRQVLAMNRRELEAAFGKEEGSRLDSQIILCRNHTKFTQGKNSELKMALEKAKVRAEKLKAASQDKLDIQDGVDSKV